MGGNVVIDGCKPEPFTLDERLHARYEICTFLVSLNSHCDDQLFSVSNKALHNCTAFSGSSNHYMNAVFSDEDLQAKQTYGDIDVIVPVESESILAEVLQPEKTIGGGEFEIIGYKKIASSFSCVVKRPNGKYAQIDFEFKDYDPNTGCPTEFAQWSQSVALVDLQAGIKGTFHKHLISSILQKDEAIRIIERKTKDAHGYRYEPGIVRAYTFAQTHGIRAKFIPGTLIGTYREPTKGQHKYIRDMDQIRDILFPLPQRDRPDPDISSFIGLAETVRDWYDEDVRDKIFTTFIGRLFDHKAMSPIDYDRAVDANIKGDVIITLQGLLRLPMSDKYNRLCGQLAAAYYAAWKHE